MKNRIKIYVVMLVAGCLLCGIIPVAYAGESEKVMVDIRNNIIGDSNRTYMFFDNNGHELPQLEYNDSIYVPIRAFSKYMNKGINWHEDGSIEVYNLPLNKHEGKTFGERQGYDEVSMIELIAEPEKFHGRKVLVKGIIHVGFESNVLFLTKEDCDYFNLSNGIRWNIPMDGFGITNDMWEFYDKVGNITGVHVEMEGTFFAQPETYPRGVLSDLQSIYCSEIV